MPHLIPYFDNKYLIVGAALCGGRAFAVLKDFYKSFLSYAMDCDDKMVYAIMDKLMEEENVQMWVFILFDCTKCFE